MGPSSIPGVSHWLDAFAKINPASRALFVFLIDEGKKEALFKSCPAFEVAAAYCTKHMDIQPGFATVSQNQATRA